MKKVIVLFFFVLVPIIQAQELSKVYLLSEGGFSAATSRLSMLDLTQDQFEENIFSPGNIGLYPDGLLLHDDQLYLTEQGNYGGSGKIYQLDTNGTVQNSSVVGTNPYSLAAANGKVYITNGPASNVSVLNLNDFTEVKTVTVGVYPQEIISIDQYVFVANTSMYGGASDSTVSVIDSGIDSVITSIVVRKDPSSLAEANDGTLLIGCPGDETNGIIYKINPEAFTKIDSFFIPEYGFGKDIAVDKLSSKIYFISYTNDIVGLDMENNEVTLVVSPSLGANYFYGYNYDYLNKKHYVLDAKDFTASGSLFIYNENGTQENTYSTGIAPRRIVFKYNGTTTGVEEETVVSSFKLEQNYPNPFNPTTNFEFRIAEGGFVSLKIYDVLGNDVATLVNEEKPAGVYNITFDANNLTSGVYMYKLTANQFTETRKMILLK